MTVKELIKELLKVKDKTALVGFVINNTFFNVEKDEETFGLTEKDEYWAKDQRLFLLGKIENE